MTPFLSLAALVVAFLAAELGARAWFKRRGQYFVLSPWTTTVMHVDRETLPRLEDEVRIEINRDGERGDPPPRDWSGTYRVLVAGGSAAECFLLDQDTAWPNVLQESLRAQAARLGARSVHVGNVARSLVACEYIERMLVKTLPRYERLDLVVLMVGASDVVAWLEKKTPDSIEEGRISTHYVFHEHPEGPFGWSPHSLALRQVAARLHKRLTHPVHERHGAGKTIGKHRQMRARASERIDEIPDPTPMLAYFEKYFRRTVQAAMEHGARVMVVRQPWLRRDFTPEEDAQLWNFGAGRPYEEEVKSYYSHRVVDELMSSVDAAASRIATELGADQLDLMPLLDHSFDTFYDRLHFTPAGARFVGETIAAAVLGDPTPSAGTRTGDVLAGNGASASA